MHPTRSRGTVSTGLLVLLALIGVLAFGGIVGGGLTLNARSQCIAAESGLKAQFDDNQNVYDNVWKDIKEEAQVTSEFVRANHDLLVAAVQGREGGAGELVRMIRESNPTLDPSIFLKVQRSIESGHARFASGQTTLLDRRREYENLYQSPSVMFANLFLSPPFPRVRLDDYKIVTSEQTSAAFSTGRADQLTVFGSGGTAGK
jgi:hypothetical protein